MDKPVYIPGGENYPIIVKGKRPSHLMAGILPSTVDATQGIPSKAGINNLDDLFAAGALQGEQTTKEMKDFGTGLVEFAKEHPVSLATGLVGGALLPATIPGMLAMGGIGAGSELADAKIRGEDVSAKDLALAAGIQGLTHGILGRAPVEGINGGQALREAVVSRGPISKFAIPEEIPQYLSAPREFGHPEGMLDILNPEYYPASARARTQELIEQGHPQWIKGPIGSGLEDKIVLNPVHKFDPLTPEGIEYYKAGGVENPTILYSAGKPTNSPYVAIKEIPGHGRQAPGKGYTFTIPMNDDAGNPITVVPKFLADKIAPAKSYIRRSEELVSPYQTEEMASYYRNYLMDNIRNGRINENNLPTGFNSVSELEDYIYSPLQKAFSEGGKGFSNQDALRMLYEIGDPRARGNMQELISLAKNPYDIDMAGGHWTDKAYADNVSPHAWQREQAIDALMGGHDELRFLNQSDPGASTYALSREELLSKAHREPTNVTAGLFSNLYISPYGLGPIKGQGNPMNLIPLTGLAAGLGYGASQAGNQ